jgi:hypothetical protein
VRECLSEKVPEFFRRDLKVPRGFLARLAFQVNSIKMHAGILAVMDKVCDIDETFHRLAERGGCDNVDDPQEEVGLSQEPQALKEFLIIER